MYAHINTGIMQLLTCPVFFSFSSASLSPSYLEHCCSFQSCSQVDYLVIANSRSTLVDLF